MDDWTTERPEPREFAAIPLIRVPPAGLIVGTITSLEVLSRNTHFAQHRTQPCPGDDCPHCLAGYSKRPHSYLSFVNRANNRQYVLELTGLAADAVFEAAKRYGHLRGLDFQAQRKQKRPNGRVEVALCPCPAGEERLPPPVDIRKFMAMLWNSPDVAAVAADPQRGRPPAAPARHDLRVHFPADVDPIGQRGNGRQE